MDLPRDVYPSIIYRLRNGSINERPLVTTARLEGLREQVPVISLREDDEDRDAMLNFRRVDPHGDPELLSRITGFTYPRPPARVTNPEPSTSAVNQNLNIEISQPSTSKSNNYMPVATEQPAGTLVKDERSSSGIHVDPHAELKEAALRVHYYLFTDLFNEESFTDVLHQECNHENLQPWLSKRRERESQHAMLHSAILEGKKSAIDDLLECGQQLCATECFIIGLLSPDTSILDYLLRIEPGGLHATHNGLSLLMCDIKYNKTPKHWEYLLSRGIDPHYCCPDGANALTVACKFNAPVEVFEALIDMQIDVNKLDSENRTPTHYLMRYFPYKDGYNKLRLLLERGVDPNLPSGNAVTLLMDAVYLPTCRNINIVELLLEHGADPRLTDGSGCNALHYCLHSAAYRDDNDVVFHTSVCTILLEHGADMYQPDKENESALMGMMIWYCMGMPNNCSFPLMKLLILHATKIRAERMARNQLYPIEVRLNFPERSGYPKHLLTMFMHLFQLPTSNKVVLCTGPINMVDPVDFTSVNNFSSPVLMDTIGSIINLVEFSDARQWMEILHKFGIGLTHPEAVSPLMVYLTRFLSSSMTPTQVAEVMQTIKFFITNGGDVLTEGFVYSIRRISTIHYMLHLPDVIWVAAAYGVVEILRLLLPYWPMNPVALLLYLCPWLERNPNMRHNMAISSAELLPFLVQLGGPLTPGTRLYAMMCEHFSIATTRLGDREQSRVIMELLSREFEELHKKPTKLKFICRNKIREQAAHEGMNIVKHLQDQVPPGMKPFLSLT